MCELVNVHGIFVSGLFFCFKKTDCLLWGRGFVAHLRDMEPVSVDCLYRHSGPELPPTTRVQLWPRPSLYSRVCLLISICWLSFAAPGALHSMRKVNGAKIAAIKQHFSGLSSWTGGERKDTCGKTYMQNVLSRPDPTYQK